MTEQPYPEEPQEGTVVGNINPWMSNKAYDVLKAIALIWLPAFGTLYLTVAATTGLPYGEEVSGVVLAVDTFLGAVLGLTGRQYRGQTQGQVVGILHVTQDEHGVMRSGNLEFAGDPQDLPNQDKVTFKVRKDGPGKRKRV